MYSLTRGCSEEVSLDIILFTFTNNNKKLNIKLLSFFSFRYLQEIGYTDTIIDVRSARVRSLLGLQPVAGNNEADGQPSLVNGEQQPKNQGKR
jgi:striatin 1/3/4